MIFLFAGFSLLHIVMVYWLLRQWTGISRLSEKAKADKHFSILVPVRNEAGNITRLLSDLRVQDYPKEKFEVIVIDDHSEDETVRQVLDLASAADVQIRLIQSDSVGKKQAITKGVSAARFDYIITTDGDCRVPPGWVSAYNSGYRSFDLVMQTGPVMMEGKGVFSALQSVEFSALIGFGAGALHAGNPSMCNGANMSYLKAVFEEVDGYLGNEQIPTGDDEFLLQKIHARYPGRIAFLKTSEAIVKTSSKKNLGSLINQRVRWTSKWKYHKSWFIRLAAIGFFIDYVLYILFLILAVSGKIDFWPWIGIVVSRWFMQLIYLRELSNFFKIRFLTTIGVSLALQIVYPIFVSLLGLASIFGRYSWKGRKYS